MGNCSVRNFLCSSVNWVLPLVVLRALPSQVGNIVRQLSFLMLYINQQLELLFTLQLFLQNDLLLALSNFFFFPPLACLNTPIFRPGKKAAYVLFLFFFIHVLSCCFLIRKTKLFGQRFLQDVISWISFSKAWLTTCIWRLQNFKRSRKDAIVLNVFPWCQLSGPDVISLRSNTIKLNFGKLSVLIPSHLIIVLATDT